MSPKRKSTRKSKVEAATETAPPASESARTYFQYVRPIENLPDGYGGIYTQSEQPCGPDDPQRESVIARTAEQHAHDLRLIRLGVGKGQSELVQKAEAQKAEAEAILQAHATLQGQRVRGRAGRRGYPVEALDYAKKLRVENPQMKAHVIRLKCLERFSENDLPPDAESFRRWLNRKRANRAN